MTDIGTKRSMNQDFYYTSEIPVGNLPNLFIVADGMGGHNAGEYASMNAVDTIVRVAKESHESEPACVLREAIEKANQILVQLSRDNPRLRGMGTTVVAAVLNQEHMYIANVGDSRLYVINEKITQITRDHSMVEEMVRIGQIDREAARDHRNKNVITRAVGVTSEVEPEFFEVELQPGDRILMCSDGLTNMVEDEEIRRIVKGQRDMAEIAERLVDTANQNGGRDNITVVVIDPLS